MRPLFLIGLWALCTLAGCVAAFVPVVPGPDLKLGWATELLRQGRPIPAEPLIVEALAGYEKNGKLMGQGLAHQDYGILLESWSMRDYLDKSVTPENRMAKGAEHLERSLEYFRLEEAQLQASGDASQVYLSYFNSAISYHWLGDDPQGCTAMAKAIEAADGSDQRNPGKKVPADHRKQMQAFVKQYACDRPRASASEQPASAPAGLEGTQIENIAWTMPATGRFPAWPRRTSIRDGRLTLSEHGMTLVGTAAMRGDNTNEVSVFYSDLSQVWLSRDGTWPQIEIAYRDGRKATVSFAGEGPVQQRVMAKQVYAWLKEKLESSNSP